jgi:TonB-linked SusC/RagA family outer membrane protein
MKKLILSLFIFLCVAASAIAQERTVTGTVAAREDNLPIPGVSVRVKEVPGVGTQTTSDGRFTLRVPAAAKTLIFTYLGYSTQELAITSGPMRVTLAGDATALNEVVVTAGGVSIQRRQQGNQATTVKAEELTQAKAFNVASALTGKVAGLQINAVSSGVNPNVRLVLRGNRSLLGNNQALVVVDNVIVPSDVLGNLNPEDIEDVQVLNGAGAASLYGSDASNGALIITTKRGKVGQTVIKVGHTTSLEQVSFLPKLQKTYGSGTGPDDVPTYTAYENQQYGPAFDGSMVDIGKPLQDGSIQRVPYSWSGEKNDFWDTGVANQTDVSLSSGDDKGSYYVSGQYFDQSSTVPGDKYNRFTVRVNGARNMGNNIDFSFNTSYVQNRYDLSTDIGNAYNNVLMSPGHIPLTRYSDWENDPYASPNGFYNEYYGNPYFTLANSRQLVRNDYLTGNAQFKWTPLKELSFLFRVSMSTRNTSNKSWTNRFDYSAYRLGITSNFNNIAGSVSDGANYNTQLNPEFQAQYIKQISKDFSLNAILGATARDNQYKGIGVSGNGLVQEGLFNVGQILQNPGASEENYRARQLGVYADARLGFRNYLYLHATARNDWRSILSQQNRSLFYPSADISFIATDALDFLKESEVINSLKIRGGISKVGLVNLGNSSNFGAYSLLGTFSQANGYPYNNVAGYTLGSRLVSPDLKPETTVSLEAGFDFELLKSRITGSFTAYKSNTKDQVVPVGLAVSSGYSTYLTNTGEVENKGIETSIRFVPVRTEAGLEITVGANYTYNANKVLSISGDQNQINLANSGSAGIYAVVGQAFPMLKGTTYQRDDQGRVIVNPVTGFPAVTSGISDLGNTEPIHRLGADMTAAYKGFRLAGLFEYRGGFVMYNAASTGFDFSGAGIRTTYFNRERFVVPNSSYLDPATNTYVPNTNITTRTGGVDFWTNGPSNTDVVENYTYSAAFWKLRELSLSYDLPKSFIGSSKYIKAARVSVQGRNLFIWTPKTNIYTDPEYSASGSNSNAIGLTTLGQTPPARMFGLSLSVTL